MRTARLLVAVALAATLSPSSVLTQVRTDFKNSWFWGLKTGVASYAAALDEDSDVNQIGAEWLLTRHRGALYIAYDQASVERTTQLADSRGQLFSVLVDDVRRITAALLAFPFDLQTIRPYGGVGLALKLIRRASLAGPAPPPESDVGALVVENRDRATVLAMAGVQAQVSRVAVFLQATGMPTQTNFLLGSRPTYVVEAGIRVNVAPSFTRF